MESKDTSRDESLIESTRNNLAISGIYYTDEEIEELEREAAKIPLDLASLEAQIPKHLRD